MLTLIASIMLFAHFIFFGKKVFNLQKAGVFLSLIAVVILAMALNNLN